MPVVELVRWLATDEFLSDLDAHFKPTVNHVSQADGCLAIYSSVEEEDKTRFWMVVVWESYEHHQAVMEGPGYVSMLNGIQPFFRDGEVKMHHVQFNKNSDEKVAFGAPVTAITFFTLKDGKVKEDLDKTLKGVTGVLSEFSGRGTYPPGVWGQTHEDSETFVLAMGYESSQVHRDLVKDNYDVFRGHLEELYETTIDVQMVHVSLKRAAEGV